MISACVRLDFYRPWILSSFRSKQRFKKWYVFLLIVALRSQKGGGMFVLLWLCCCGCVVVFVLLWLTTLLQFYVLRKLYEQYIIKRESKFVISFLIFLLRLQFVYACTYILWHAYWMHNFFVVFFIENKYMNDFAWYLHQLWPSIVSLDLDAFSLLYHACITLRKQASIHDCIGIPIFRQSLYFLHLKIEGPHQAVDFRRIVSLCII